KVSGKGGIPVSPYTQLIPNQIFSDWGILHSNSQEKYTRISKNTLNNKQTNLTEAQGFIQDEKGNIILTSQPLQVTVNGVYLHPLDCERLQKLNVK
ncbi:MAG TPA: hypothetical protein V6C58_19470, partial [Allocoleopsis sp.]